MTVVECPERAKRVERQKCSRIKSRKINDRQTSVVFFVEALSFVDATIRSTMKLYRLLIFLSAFLLFLVQPLLTKVFLPWFGGSASVWATSLMFFTTVLLCGYVYAHILANVSQRIQLRVHAILLVLCGIVILAFWIKWGSPLSPSVDFRPDPQANPTWALLSLFSLVIAFPYILLSSTSPLLQSWFFKTNKKTAYRLYAVSNIGSLGALLSYPFIFEPLFSLQVQGWIWGIGFLSYMVLMLWLVRSLRQKPFEQTSSMQPEAQSVPQVFLWVFLAFMPAFLLVATTNTLTQGIASFPLLWVAPLAVYLITFILAFSDYQIRPRFLLIITACFSIIALFFLDERVDAFLQLYLSILLPLLFFGCFFFHKWLYNIRPDGYSLTTYYLWIAFGGACGTAICAVGFPLLFSRPVEMIFSVLVVLAFALWKLMVLFVPSSIRELFDKKILWFFVIMNGCVVLLFLTFGNSTALFEDRTFYSVVKVSDIQTAAGVERRLLNGKILHGAQLVADKTKPVAISYYGHESGIGRLLTMDSSDSRRVGIVGLGTGAIAAYCRPGDEYRFFEIDPMVESVAREWFSYLRVCAGSDVVLGDGRLSLEQEDQEQAALYDVLVIDAFSDDSIPVHLLTKEAIDLYFHRLKPSGVVAVHISNRYLDLQPVLRSYIQQQNRFGVLIKDNGDEDQRTLMSVWVLLSEDKNVLPLVDGQTPEDFAVGKTVTWTDHYSNLLSVIRL